MSDKPSEPIIVYGSSFSPFVRKLLAYLTERGLAMKLAGIGLGSEDPGFRAASPLGKMPAIRDGDYALSDSSAIIHYCEAKHGRSGLFPEGAEALGRAIWFEEFADTAMFESLRPAFFNRVVKERFLGGGGDMAAADKAEREDWPSIADYLEAELEKREEWLVGEAFSIADLAVGSALHNADHARVPIGERPALAAYYERVKARPCFAKWTEKEFAVLAG